MTNYKKIFSATICFALLLLAIPAYAAEKTIVGVSTIYESKKGKSTEVEIYIKSTEAIASGQIELEYDPSSITISKDTPGEALTSFAFHSTSIEQPGQISLSWAKEAGEIIDGTILSFTAKLAKDIESLPLTLKNVKLFNEDGSSMDAELYNGEIKPFPTNGEQKKHATKVDSNKEWTIRFNTEISPATFNKHTVKVTTSTGKLVDLYIKQIDKKTFEIRPKESYSRGTYTLEVTEQIRSTGGKKLKAPWQFVFTVN